MNRKNQLVALMIILIAAISCDKDSDNSDAVTKTDLLTAGTWKLIAATINPAYDYYGDGNAVTDLYAILKPCEKDDFEIYKTNGTWEYNEGPAKCDPSYPQVFSEPWSFTANETKVFVGAVECTILELTQTALKLRYSFDDAGVTYTEEDTYEH